MIAMPMPASPQNSSSTATGSVRPVGSTIALIRKSTPYRPIWAASSTIGHGNSSRSSHSWPAGRTTASAKSWTHFWICSWSSLSDAENSGMALSYHAGNIAVYPSNRPRRANGCHHDGMVRSAPFGSPLRLTALLVGGALLTACIGGSDDGADEDGRPGRHAVDPGDVRAPARSTSPIPVETLPGEDDAVDRRGRSPTTR